MTIKRSISEKGLATQSLIYANAKKIFSLKGYKNARMAQIAYEAKVPLGSVTYYFKTKDLIAHEIFSDYMVNIKTELAQYKWYRDENMLFKFFIDGCVYYENIFKTEAGKRFYYEVLQLDSCTGFYFNDVFEIYKSFFSECNITLSDEEFKACLYADLGARREFWIKYIDGEISLPLEDAIKKALEIMPLMLKIPYCEMERIWNKCKECASKSKTADILLLEEVK